MELCSKHVKNVKIATYSFFKYTKFAGDLIIIVSQTIEYYVMSLCVHECCIFCFFLQIYIQN